jgi:hypothetical protein
MNLYLKKYIKYKTKYLNLIGGMQDFEILNKCELYLDKIFFHAIALFNEKFTNPQQKLIITGRKVNELYNRIKVPLNNDGEFLYTIYIDNTINIQNHIINLINELNTVSKTILINSKILLLIYNNLMSALNIDNFYKIPNNLFDYVDADDTIIYNISPDKQIRICNIIKADLTIKNPIEYPLRRLVRHYSRSVQYYTILLDDINSSTSDNLIVLIESKDPRTRSLQTKINHFDSLIITYNKLLLTNDDIECIPQVYDNITGTLKHFNHNYKIYKDIIEEIHAFNSNCQGLPIAPDILINKIPHELKQIVSDTTFPQSFMMEYFFIGIRDRYIHDSSTINNIIFQILSGVEYTKLSSTTIKVNSVNIDIFLFIYVFRILMQIVNNPKSSLKKFNVYSVSQSLYNFDDKTLQFEKGQIYTFPIFKSTTLASKYNDNPAFIGCDITPLVFDIEIDPAILTGSEFIFMNTDQYEVVLDIGSRIEIIDIDTCYTKFTSKRPGGSSSILLQECTHLKAKLLNAGSRDITFDRLSGGNPNQFNSKITPEIKKIQEIKKIRDNILSDFNTIKQNIDINPFTFYYHELENYKELSCDC